MDDMLKYGLMIGCPDGAVHDITKTQNNGVVTYSLNIVIRILIEKLGIRPSSR